MTAEEQPGGLTVSAGGVGGPLAFFLCILFFSRIPSVGASSAIRAQKAPIPPSPSLANPVASVTPWEGKLQRGIAQEEAARNLCLLKKKFHYFFSKNFFKEFFHKKFSKKFFTKNFFFPKTIVK